MRMVCSISWSTISHNLLCDIAIYLHPSSLNRSLSFEDFEIALSISILHAKNNDNGYAGSVRPLSTPRLRLREHSWFGQKRIWPQRIDARHQTGLKLAIVQDKDVLRDSAPQRRFIPSKRLGQARNRLAALSFQQENRNDEFADFE